VVTNSNNLQLFQIRVKKPQRVEKEDGKDKLAKKIEHLTV